MSGGGLWVQAEELHSFPYKFPFHQHWAKYMRPFPFVTHVDQSEPLLLSTY